MISRQLVFEYPEYITDSEENELTSELKKTQIDFFLEKTPITSWAAHEWIIPGLFSVYILKPYFEAFLSEAGKDHYAFLKGWLGKIARKTKTKDVKRLTNSGDKLDIADTQSKAFSIYFQSSKNQRIKFMFDNELNEEQWLISIDDLVQLLYDHYEEFPDDKLSGLMKSVSVEEERELYAIIDRKNKSWKFVNFNELLRIEFTRKVQSANIKNTNK